MSKLIVTAPNGNTVNLRASPSKSAFIKESIPIKTEVELIEKTSDEWYKIKYKNEEGYMMSKFLIKAGAISQEDLKDVYNSLKDTLVLIEKILK